MVDGCVFRTFMDVLLWTGLLSEDRERVCISEDDDAYLEDISPTLGGRNGDAMVDRDWE